MTRINCVPASELVNKHLIAEYRELPRVRHAYPRKLSPLIPSRYMMGKGHVTFFYDKGMWLENRHRELIAEMKSRGITVNLPPLDLSHWGVDKMNDWNPSQEEIEINRERITRRLSEVQS